MSQSTPAESLANKKCVPCEGNQPALDHAESKQLAEKINEWTIIEDTHIEKTLTFKNFAEALAFVNHVGDIAEREGHHPDIRLHNWNRVTLSLTTHAIGGLSENDFILAAKIDQINAQ